MNLGSKVMDNDTLLRHSGQGAEFENQTASLCLTVNPIFSQNYEEILIVLKIYFSCFLETHRFSATALRVSTSRTFTASCLRPALWKAKENRKY